MHKVGVNIKNLRIKRNETQGELAELLKISRQSLSNYETGKRLPDISMLVKLADVFEISIDSLIGREWHDYSQSPYNEAKGLCKGYKKQF